MRVVQTVFGVFHHFELARELERRGMLQAVFSTWPWQRLKREELPRHRVHTFPWLHTPELLLNRYSLLPTIAGDWLGYANALVFDEYTLRRVPPDCDALIGISGSSLKTGALVQRRGGRFICDRGSSHQRYQEQIVSDEFRRWGVHAAVSDVRDTVREEAIYDMADAISVPSTFSARSFVEMGVPAAKLHRMTYGVRLERFHPAATPQPSPTERFEALFVGSVGLRKGVPYLLQAFAALKHPNKRLRVVGSLSGDLAQVLKRLPTDGVEFLGSQPQTHVAEIMAESHLLLLPSVEDGSGLVLGQAMACGCPVVASTNTGGPDLITDGVEGFIVPIRDPVALQECMQRVVDDPELWLRMRSAGLERVRRIGGWVEYGDQWQRLLQKLTGKD